jgi:hypothetical protein
LAEYNVDAIIAAPLGVTISGQKYLIPPMTVKEYMATQSAQAETAEAFRGNDIEAQANATTELVVALSKKVIPAEALEALTVGQLMALVERLGEFQKSTKDDDLKNQARGG